MRNLAPRKAFISFYGNYNAKEAIEMINKMEKGALFLPLRNESELPTVKRICFTSKQFKALYFPQIQAQ